MALNPGTRLGPYEIVAPLGAGGMGEVYRARDSRLGRDVAVKVLPQHLSDSPEVRARFEREARTVSSLNHPHICTLFDVGREGDTDFLVMELVDGETLATRLANGALPGPEVLKLGAQIADALDRAHRSGVVHRDLKPGNVMLTRSGAKLMDFGLARATGLSGAPGSSVSVAGLTQSPTMAQPLTAEGTIVGTFQYMSPEQMEGREADARSDLWAFGCVLYEMATGKRAFHGRSQASLISSIMSSEPPPISQVAPLSPPGLDRLVRTCLAKDPEERVQTAHDVKLQLQGISEAGSQAGAPVPVIRRTGSRERLAWTVAAVAALVAVAAVALLLVTGRSGQSRPVQLSLTPPPHGQFSPSLSAVTVSPDGQSVAFGARDSSGKAGLWVQRLDSPGPALLTETVGMGSIFWSPDSRSLGYLDGGEGKLKTISVAGGTPATLCDARSPRGGTWNRRGDIVFAPLAQGPLFRVPASGGEPVQATWIDATRHEEAHRFPCFLPDGDHFLYVSLPAGPNGFDVYAGSLGSRSVRKIMSAQSAPIYAEPGYLIFERGGKVMAQRFNARSLALESTPVALADAPPFSDVSAEPFASASRAGRLVFMDDQLPDTQLKWFGREGAELGTLPLAPGRWGRPVLSPDDRYAAVPNGDDLWRVDLQRSVALRLTSNGGVNSNPVWSPDGSRIAWTLSDKAREEIYTMNSDGSGEPRLVPTTTDLFKNPECWTRDGLVITDIGGGTFRDIWIVPVEGGGKATPLIQTRFAEHLSAVSPDGHWIAYLSNEAGFEDVYVQSFPVPGHKVRVSSGGALRVWWLGGNDELCYSAANTPDAMSVKLTVQAGDLQFGTPKLLFHRPHDLRGSDFTHDGKRALFSLPIAASPERKLRVILDWTGLLKR